MKLRMVAMGFIGYVVWNGRDVWFGKIIGIHLVLLLEGLVPGLYTTQLAGLMLSKRNSLLKMG